ncbi:kunitz trypsin inhibitor 5-like [Beta vulgaris subsp. vulgaris]|uniref:kunitz trypsin inhibitor 5-like n=1 Tax=Beta vulgaris subsp. vulgaris TaxID=3555 RepID=UPI0020367675|nr:kunitz trypsin inhibitor 5-like [Beta vulgaris subsp. vulgaris]
MGIGIPSIVATFLLLILFLSPPTTNAQVVDIFDMDGDVVVTGRNYYVLPVVQRRGGGISTAPESAIQKCPLYVVQETNTASLGLPVTFYGTNRATQNVTFSTVMNIVFASSAATKECGALLGWMVAETAGKRFVVPGGNAARGSSGKENWFTIERFFPRFHFDYKFKFCSSDNTNCGDLGVEVQLDGTWRLVVGAAPLRIKFKKA